MNVKAVFIPYFRNFNCVRVCSLIGNCFYNMYIVKLFEVVFPLMSRTIKHFHVYIILDFCIKFRNASVLCQSEYTCLHKAVNMEVFFVKSKENTYSKGKALVQMYRVVTITKEGIMP